jgi:hypothetical protein
LTFNIITTANTKVTHLTITIINAMNLIKPIKQKPGINQNGYEKAASIE